MTKKVLEKPTCFWRSRIVGGRAALDIDGTVLHQRDAVGGSDRHQLDVELGQLLVFLNRLGDLEQNFVGEADDLLLVVVVRERNRGLTVTEGNRTGFFDLLQRRALLRNDRAAKAAATVADNTEGSSFMVVSPTVGLLIGLVSSRQSISTARASTNDCCNTLFICNRRTGSDRTVRKSELFIWWHSVSRERHARRRLRIQCGSFRPHPRFPHDDRTHPLHRAVAGRTGHPSLSRQLPVAQPDPAGQRFALPRGFPAAT